MTKLTIQLEDKVLSEPSQIAATHQTTVQALVERYLAGLGTAGSGDAKSAEAASRLQELFDHNLRSVDTRTWTRDELYDR